MNHCNTTIKKKKKVHGLVACEKAVCCRDGRPRSFQSFCFVLLPLFFPSPLETLRTLALNMKESPEIHLYTFWVEKLTADILLFTNL